MPLTWQKVPTSTDNSPMKSQEPQLATEIHKNTHTFPHIFSHLTNHTILLKQNICLLFFFGFLFDSRDAKYQWIKIDYFCHRWNWWIVHTTKMLPKKKKSLINFRYWTHWMLNVINNEMMPFVWANWKMQTQSTVIFCSQSQMLKFSCRSDSICIVSKSSSNLTPIIDSWVNSSG